MGNIVFSNEREHTPNYFTKIEDKNEIISPSGTFYKYYPNKIFDQYHYDKFQTLDNVSGC
jgi:tRNA A37 threonylcarbamoyladenosine biosynthesis protein TsaE